MTLPAHATLFTGVYPIDHGVHLNGQRTLRADLPTLAERMRDTGRETAAFVAAYVLGQEFGLDRGFDRYDDSDGWLATRNIPRSLRHLLLSQAFSRIGLTSGGTLERAAARVTDLALQWLDGRDGRPWFLWVHYFEPHGPHEATEDALAHHMAQIDRARRAAADSLAPGNPSLDPLQHLLAIRDAGGYPDETVAAYQAEIEETDRQLGRILAALDASGERDRTVIVVTADHGQAFGEDGYQGHLGSVGTETLAVPAFLWSSALESATTDRGAQDPPPPLRHVDVLPTLLELLGEPVPEGLPGTPRGLGAPAPPDPDVSAIYFESLTSAKKNVPRVGVRRGEILLIASPAGTPQLLARDVHWGEGRDWGEPLDPESAAGSELLAALEAILARGTGSLATDVTVRHDPETAQALRALGYLD